MSCSFCQWDPPRLVTPEHAVSTFSCPTGGCLYNVMTDPAERHELSAQNPAKLAEPQTAFAKAQATVWWSRGSPDRDDSTLCAAVAAHGNHVAPYRVPGAMPCGAPGLAPYGH